MAALKELTEKDEDKFAEAITATMSINFPQLAENLGLDWFQQVRPAMRRRPEFVVKIKHSLERLRYEAYSRMFESGLSGVRGNGKDPNWSLLNPVLKILASGELLGEDAAEESPAGDNAVKAHLEAMNEVPEKDHN